MKWCWHNYQTDKSRKVKQIVLFENDKGRFVRTLFPEVCIKCGKTRYWGFGKEWVWKGDLSTMEYLDNLNRFVCEIATDLAKTGGAMKQ
jgi:hypothetical protein